MLPPSRDGHKPVVRVIARRTLLRAAGAVVCAPATALSRPRVGLAGAEPENLAELLVPIRSRHGMPALAAAYVRGTDLALHRDHFAQGYALGWELVDRAWARGRTLTHRGSTGLWYAVIWIAPSRNVAFLAATNCGGEEGRRARGAAGAAMINKFL